MVYLLVALLLLAFGPNLLLGLALPSWIPGFLPVAVTALLLLDSSDRPANRG